MLTNDELDRLEIDADSPQAMPAKASVLALVGELRAERTRTETLHDALDTYVIGCFMCGGTGVVIRPPKYDEVTCRECEDARAALAASVEEPK